MTYYAPYAAWQMDKLQYIPPSLYRNRLLLSYVQKQRATAASAASATYPLTPGRLDELQEQVQLAQASCGHK